MASDPSLHRCAGDANPADAEALAYERFAQAQAVLDIEAATWAARQRGGLDAAGQAELDAWLAQDSRHQNAYDEMNDTLGRLHEMPAQAVHTLRSGLAQPCQPTSGVLSDTPEVCHITVPASSGAEPKQGAAQTALPGFGWRHWLALQLGRVPQLGMAAMALLLAGAGCLAWWWLHLPDFAQRFATAPGQTLQVALPDGSRLQLDAATQLRVRLYPDRRELQLEEGQAYFDVEPDAQRPFKVEAGPVRVTVLGTRFVVRRTQAGLDAGAVRVAVEQGHVRVSSLQEAAVSQAAIDLVAGQAVLARPQENWSQVHAVAVNEVAPWQSGRINFIGTPLKQALAEFQRYGAPVVEIHDPVVAALPVGGSFKVDNFAGFLEILSLQLPVRLEPQDQTQVLVRRH